MSKRGAGQQLTKDGGRSDDEDEIDVSTEKLLQLLKADATAWPKIGAAGSRRGQTVSHLEC